MLNHIFAYADALKQEAINEKKLSKITNALRLSRAKRLELTYVMSFEAIQQATNIAIAKKKVTK